VQLLYGLPPHLKVQNLKADLWLNYRIYVCRVETEYKFGSFILCHLHSKKYVNIMWHCIIRGAPHRCVTITAGLKETLQLELYLFFILPIISAHLSAYWQPVTMQAVISRPGCFFVCVCIFCYILESILITLRRG